MISGPFGQAINATNSKTYLNDIAYFEHIASYSQQIESEGKSCPHLIVSERLVNFSLYLFNYKIIQHHTGINYTNKAYKFTTIFFKMGLILINSSKQQLVQLKISNTESQVYEDNIKIGKGEGNKPSEIISKRHRLTTLRRKKKRRMRA